MAEGGEKRYLYRNKITGAEFRSTSICCGGAWELVKILRTPAKAAEEQPRQRRVKLTREVNEENE